MRSCIHASLYPRIYVYIRKIRRAATSGKRGEKAGRGVYKYLCIHSGDRYGKTGDSGKMAQSIHVFMYTVNLILLLFLIPRHFFARCKSLGKKQEKSREKTRENPEKNPGEPQGMYTCIYVYRQELYI